MEIRILLLAIFIALAYAFMSNQDYEDQTIAEQSAKQITNDNQRNRNEH